MQRFYIVAGLVIVLLLTFGALVLRPGHDQTVNQQGRTSQNDSQ